MGRLLCLTGLLALGGCQVDEGFPPVARFTVTPSHIPQDDGYATTVTLDGTTSGDGHDDPEGVVPLWFRWELDDPGLQVVGGGLLEPVVQVRLRGDRPTAIRLIVLDGDGYRGERTGVVGMTLPDHQ